MSADEKATHEVAAKRAVDYANFLAERNAKIGLGEKQGSFIDQSLLTLSGGALGLLLTFLHEHGTGLHRIGYAKAGVVLLILSLLSVFLSLYASQRSISRHIDALDDWCRAGLGVDDPQSRPLQTNPWRGATKVLNLIAGLGFLSGIVCLAFFVTSNLST